MKEELKEFNYLIDSYSWNFAKSMPKLPHEYIIRENIVESDVELFEKFIHYIRDYGIRAHFFRREYDYLLLGDYYYWTMGNPVAETKVLNRAHINNSRLKKVRDYYIMEISDNVLF